MQKTKHKTIEKGLKIEIVKTNYAGEILAMVEIKGDEIIVTRDSDIVISVTDGEGNHVF